MISANEYREASGRKRVVNQIIADSLLSNPNQTPIANTEKAMNEAEPKCRKWRSFRCSGSGGTARAVVTEFSPEAGGFVEAGYR